MVKTHSSSTLSSDTFVGPTTILSGQLINQDPVTIVQSGGVVQDCEFTSGVVEEVLSGGVDSGSVIDVGARQIIMSGGVAENNVIFGSQSILMGGQSISAQVSGGAITVGYGGVAAGTQVAASGLMRVVASGRATDVTVDSGGVVILTSASNGVGMLEGGVVAGGAELIDAGIASGTEIQSGGLLLVSGGMASAVMVDSGSLMVLYDGAEATGTVSSGGDVVSTGVVVISGTNGTYEGAVYSSAAVSGAEVLVIQGDPLRAARSPQASSTSIPAAQRWVTGSSSTGSSRFRREVLRAGSR